MSQRYYRATRHDLQATLDKIDADGFEVTQIASDENGLDLIAQPTKPRRATQAKETR